MQVFCVLLLIVINVALLAEKPLKITFGGIVHAIHQNLGELIV